MNSILQDSGVRAWLMEQSRRSKRPNGGAQGQKRVAKRREANRKASKSRTANRRIK